MALLAACADQESDLSFLPGDVEVVVIPELCRSPRRLEKLAGSTLLVVGVHDGEYSAGRIRAALRRAAVDPLGVEIIHLHDDARRLGVEVSGAVARAAAFPGATPEQIKINLPRWVNRDQFLTLLAPPYVAAPQIDPTRCVADRGCRACVFGCPVDALHGVGSTIQYDKESCITCGRCVTTCPVGAVDHPTSGARQTEAQVMALVAASSQTIGVRYRCRRSDPEILPEGWYAVEIACTTMLTVGWLLAPLVLGAGAVSATRCSNVGCPVVGEAVLDQRMGVAADVLAGAGLDPGRVDWAAGPIGDPIGVAASVDPYRAGSEIHIVGTISGSLRLAAKEAAAGIVTIEAATCTACAQCSVICPTAALTAAVDDDIQISFRAERCVGCGQCLTACPELERGAISLWQGYDLEAASDRAVVVRTASIPACERCGAPIAPAAMLERIGSIFGDDHAGTLDFVSRRCLDCRALE